MKSRLEREKVRLGNVAHAIKECAQKESDRISAPLKRLGIEVVVAAHDYGLFQIPGVIRTTSVATRFSSYGKKILAAAKNEKD